MSATTRTRRTRPSSAKKTTFSLSHQAVEDVQHITEKQDISTRFLVEHLCSLLDDSISGSTFMNLTQENIVTEKNELNVKKSWTAEHQKIERLKRLSKSIGTSRNALLDAAIKTYRLIIDYEHPVAQKDLRGLKRLLDDLNSNAIFEKYDIALHPFFAPLSSPTDEILEDQIISGLYELSEAVDEEYYRVFGDEE